MFQFWWISQWENAKNNFQQIQGSFELLVGGGRPQYIYIYIYITNIMINMYVIYHLNYLSQIDLSLYHQCYPRFWLNLHPNFKLRKLFGNDTSARL